jgi:beta-glucosidase-like glycosyl hydrolase
MGALSKNGFPPEIAAVKAIEAGVDIIMLSEKKFWNVAELLLKKAAQDKNFEAELMRAVKNVLRFKIKSGILQLTEIERVSETDATSEKIKDSEKNSDYTPLFSLQISQAYPEFDLKKFDEDFKSGMAAYNF